MLTENGEIFDLWAKPPVDLYIKIYLFNITNADEFLAGKEKMRVQQIGPYVYRYINFLLILLFYCIYLYQNVLIIIYREMLTHENITFNPNGTLSTTPSHPLVWQEHLSEGHKEDDNFVLPNIALLVSLLLYPTFFIIKINI